MKLYEMIENAKFTIDNEFVVKGGDFVCRVNNEIIVIYDSRNFNKRGKVVSSVYVTIEDIEKYLQYDVVDFFDGCINGVIDDVYINNHSPKEPRAYTKEKITVFGKHGKKTLHSISVGDYFTKSGLLKLMTRVEKIVQYDALTDDYDHDYLTNGGKGKVFNDTYIIKDILRNDALSAVVISFDILKIVVRYYGCGGVVYDLEFNLKG